MDLDLRGKYALVGGSSKGLGKASAIELAALGATVTLVSRGINDLISALRELPVPFGQIHDYLLLDYDHPDMVKAAVSAKLVEHPYQILVNNTGGPPGGPIVAAANEEFIAAFTRHLLVNQLLVGLLLPGMKESGFGRIINVISTSVKQPLPGLGVSNTIRGAVANWAKTLASETAQWGITVNNVLPGATNTERLSSIISSKAEKQQTDIAQINKAMKSEIPMGRFAEPHEFAAAVAFLASPAAGYITGINLPVDGGRTSCL
ncbi:MAG: SDR family oxidoreductase [Saprospiraceae bacterium]|jgi:3-oxoacyl-[acyl-carrier protein] reductase|nr:SDR family oxidoreductase [Saprospiraceae bacterium]